MVVDEAIKYNSLYQNALHIIDNISELGFNVDIYRQKLININEMVNKSVNDNFMASIQTAKYEQIYTDGIKELEIITNALEKYDVYYKVLNSCKYIDIKIGGEISLDELKKCVAEMIYNLKTILKSNTVNYQDEEEIVHRVYETAYRLIKLELAMTMKSELYNTAIKNEINCSYFSKLVRNDIDRLKIDNEQIKAKLYEIRKAGINCNYFDIDLIGMIVYQEYGDVFKNNLVGTLEALAKDIKGYADIVSETGAEFGKVTADADATAELIKNTRKPYLRRKIVSFALAISLITGWGSLLPILAKVVSRNKIYKETTEIYSSLDDKTNVTTKEVEKAIFENTDITYVREHMAGENKYHEYVLIGDKLELATAKDYYLYGEDNNNDYGVEYSSKKETSHFDGATTDYTEVKKVTYEYLRTADNDGERYVLTVCFYVMFIASMLANGVPKSLIEMYKKDIVETYKNAKDEKARVAALKENAAKLYKVIERNSENKEEFAKRFGDLYNKYSYLLDDYDALISMLDAETAKKYMKKK